jgi:hypothetical protein
MYQTTLDCWYQTHPVVLLTQVKQGISYLHVTQRLYLCNETVTTVLCNLVRLAINHTAGCTVEVGI